MSDDAAVMENEQEVESQVEAPVESTPEPSAPAPQQAAPSQPKASVWDAFKALPDFKDQDEVSIARRLYESMEREKVASRALAQYQQYIPYAQQYLQHREPFERWMAQQSQAQQAPQPQQPPTPAEAIKKWWNPPEVRESYKQYLVKDENGREVISPEAPLDAKHALYEYQKYKADFAQKFLTDPEGALGPMVQEIAQQQAQRIVAEQFEEVQQHQYVAGIEKENRDWLYDEQGQPTQEGLSAQRYIEEAASMGIQSPDKRWDYATKMIERDLLEQLRGVQQQSGQKQAFESGLAQVSQPPVMPAQAPQEAPEGAPAASSQAQRDMNFLRREASRNPSKSTGNSDPRAPQEPLTFEQRLARQLRRDGIAD